MGIQLIVPSFQLHASRKPVNFFSPTCRARAEMSGCLSKSLGSSSSYSLKTDHEEQLKAEQDTVSILGCDCDGAARSGATPLRRTLSADMSSKTWLTQNGFSPSKNIASSDEEEEVTNSSSSSGGKERECREGSCQDIWSLIQEEQRKKKIEGPCRLDAWSSILSEKANGDFVASKSSLPPPYVHPLARRSASSLSEKSLEICTESLGSETGSGGFLSYPLSHPGESEVEKAGVEEEEGEYSRPFDGEKLRVVRHNYAYNYSTCSRRAPPRSIPPPLPSLAQRDGCDVHMCSHRQNGRLVVEAITVPSQNCFRAQRQDGRLLLTLANTNFTEEKDIEGEENEIINEATENELEEIKEEEDEEEEEVETNEEEAEEEEEESIVVRENKAAKELAIIMESVSRPPTAVMNMRKLFSITKSSAWPCKFNKVVTTLVEAEEEEDEEVDEAALPPRPRVPRLLPKSPATAAAAAATFNAYKYYWQSKSAAAVVLKPLSQQTPPLKPSHSDNCKFVLAHNYNYQGKSKEQRELVVVKGKEAEYLVPLLRGCKEQRRRSLIFWEPDCIAIT
ncbi:hypothetical protein Nepgr_000243 [Nepenthes gracilis]|uniref:FAF domain-containing protein n=1 Tax=Nepenthes gracilis TaxID=150966 RepID=A0AAD3P5Y8_NEPGR|nr:hypothetical protein Nepgr_000243 [Nepenthes gracilis]